MKRGNKKIYLAVLVALLACGFLLATTVQVMATEGEGGADWRPTYDIIMKWVNFIILVAVFIKFAYRPLKNFLSEKREEIALQIKNMTEEKDQLQLRIREAQTEMEESTVRLEEIKERIVQMGERRKQDIIDGARQQGQMIIEGAKQKMEGRVLQARNRLRAEIVDAAAEMALENLPRFVTEEDQHNLLDQFMAKVAAK
ncbi:MAG: ATP synthase F0 subunit B [Desulfobacterales bacterium]